MDCCNFMPYRPPYYGTPYYENIPYPADYYGHPYQDYYGTSPYYAQSWQCAAPFTDYVYNPKEARIRKAMREASRERALGVAPMPSPRGTRRSTAWNFSEEEQLMMTPSHAMRGIIGSPMCTSPGFPISTTGNGPFMQSMHYNKHVHHMPHTSGNYMQPNPIAQMPPPSEIWHPYEDSLRTPPSGTYRELQGPYMMPPQISSPYQQSQEISGPNVLPQDKPKLEPESFAHTDDMLTSHTNENVPPNMDGQKMMNEPVFENKVDSIQPLIETGNMQHPETFMPTTYTENVMTHQRRYETDDMKMKKENVTQAHYFHEQNRFGTNMPNRMFMANPPYAANLNSARSQDVQYHKEYIRKYLESSECDTLEILAGGNGMSDGFSYVTYPCPQVDHFMTSVDMNDIFLLKNFNANCHECEDSSEALNLSRPKSPAPKTEYGNK